MRTLIIFFKFWKGGGNFAEVSPRLSGSGTEQYRISPCIAATTQHSLTAVLQAACHPGIGRFPATCVVFSAWRNIGETGGFDDASSIHLTQ